MAKSTTSDIRKQAQAIRDRLDGGAFTIPRAFKAHAKTFVAVQGEYEDAALAVEQAEVARDDALAAVGTADDALDASLDAYAHEVSAARLGPRLNPFKPFSKHSPSALKELAYATEAKEVRALVAAIAKSKPPAAVAKAGSACLARCAAVEKALKELGKPSSAYQKALAARDALLPDMQKAMKTLRTHAASAFVDDPGALGALFAPPDAVQAPRQRRRKKATATGETGTTTPA